MFFVFFISMILIIYMLYYRYKTKKFRELMNVYGHYIKSVPIVGIAYHLIGNNEDRMKGIQYIGLQATKGGGVVPGWFGPLPYIMISDPVVAEVVLKECLEKDSTMKILKELIGDGLNIAPLSIWRTRRKIITPTFASKNLKKFVKIFSKQSKGIVESLKNSVGKGPFPIWNYIASYKLYIICESVFGVQMHDQRIPVQQIFKDFTDLAAVVAARLTQPWLHSEMIFKFLPQYKIFLRGRKTLYDIVDEVLEKKHKEIDDNKNTNISTENKDGRFRSFLDLLIESSAQESGSYSDKELREETVTLTIAGTDTSAASVAFTLLALSRYQDVQDKVYKEVVDVLGDTIEEDYITMENLKNLVYLEAAIKESMRLYPSVPVILRNITQDVTLPSGMVLPAGCGSVINIWAIHRNKKYWGEDAEEFRPERFLDTPFKHPAQFMAFSYGPRNCPGGRFAMLSMKTVLLTLLHRYRVLPGPEEPRLSFEIMMKDANGYTIQLELRNNKNRT